MLKKIVNSNIFKAACNVFYIIFTMAFVYWNLLLDEFRSPDSLKKYLFFIILFLLFNALVILFLYKDKNIVTSAVIGVFSIVNLNSYAGTVLMTAQLLTPNKLLLFIKGLALILHITVLIYATSKLRLHYNLLVACKKNAYDSLKKSTIEESEIEKD